MGVYITSGVLASFKKMNEEAFENYSSVFKNINKLLKLNSLTPYDELPVYRRMIGSSYTLFNELKFIANTLNIQLNREDKSYKH